MLSPYKRPGLGGSRNKLLSDYIIRRPEAAQASKLKKPGDGPIIESHNFYARGALANVHITFGTLLVSGQVWQDMNGSLGTGHGWVREFRKPLHYK